MPNDNELPGNSIPLPADIQEAIDAFNRPDAKSKAIRTATTVLLFEDLKEEIRKLLKDRGM
jgi:hypothetical protein